MKHLPTIALLVLVSAALSACKIVVTIPEGGRVVSEDGFVCLAGETCRIDVADTSFDSTFRAIPEPGYSFARWNRKPSAFCGDRRAPCTLSTRQFGPHEALLDILATDQEFFLEPVFVHYDLGYWQRVLSEIETQQFSTDAFLYALQPVVSNCDPGALSAGAGNRALRALNQVRALHRLPPVELDNFYAMQVQEASLVQRANNYLNHFPEPGDTCYTAGAREGSSSSNLSGSSRPVDPADDVFGWTNDNNNLSNLMAAGHRRWLLFPQLGYASYGQVEGFSALKVSGFNRPPRTPVSAGLEYIAFPYKTYPHVLVSGGDKPTPWSFSLVPPTGTPGGLDYFRNALVTVTERDTGNKLSVHSLHRDNKGYGLANFLSWMVADWRYDTAYTVTVSNIRMPDGDIREIQYPVVIDRYHLLNLNHPLEAGDSRRDNNLQGRFDSALDRDSYAISLAGSRTIIGRSEFSNQGFFILLYDPDKNLVKSSDQSFEFTFTGGRYTLVISPCDENGLCYRGTSSYSVAIQ